MVEDRLISLIHDECALTSLETKLFCVTWTRLQQYESEKQQHFVSTELNTGSSYFTGVLAFHEILDNLQNLTLNFYSCL